jgi:predicted metallopeptidase
MAYIFEKEKIIGLQNIIRDYYLSALNLQHWTVYVVLDRAKNMDAQLETETLNGRYYASIFVGRVFSDLPIQEMHNCLIHELLHFPQDRIIVHVNSMTSRMDGNLKQAIYDVIHNEIEYNTDWLAGVLENFIPIPDSLYEWAGQEKPIETT